ncbi:MAG: SDR family NAD(P)-dependent oxidoreductase [Acidobacteriia bacterium]|nr:SDR family NAD(P)-dependent oxidoreductase [Terriglobia bacterium]
MSTIPSPMMPASGSRLRAIEDDLAGSLADTLDIDPRCVERNRSFSEIGVDSIVAVQWTRGLNARYSIALASTTLFDYPTVQSLAAFVHDLLGESGQSEPSVEVQPESAGNEPSIKMPEGAGEHALSSRQSRARGYDDPIAIIGIAGQFPMARTVGEFWANLSEGRDCVSEVPPDRWSFDGVFQAGASARGKSYSKWMGVLEDVDKFDPAFFSLAPSEAEWMDPQQRLFLQQCWRCLEDGGIDPFNLSGARCGIFAGCSRVDYGSLISADSTNAYRMMGTSMAMLTARVAYFLNLKGPCFTIDTASSSSLVAIAQACDSLTLGHSDLALAGGVSVLNGPALHIASCDAGMLSPTGRCFSFDERADGFVPAEAIAVVLLKRLEEAVRDGHHIYGVIRGWGINQDGKTNGITAPSALSQARLQKEVYERFAIDPATITLVEAHGTGTRLGDPIEIDALTQSFGAFTKKQGYCALSSTKSNIGHAMAAAGAVGVIKSALALKHRMIPPMAHFKRPNEHIAFEGSPFSVNTELRIWEATDGAPRRVAVNSFGFGGTNAHVVLEEFVPAPAPNPPAVRPPALIVLSARTEGQLEKQARLLLEAFRSGSLEQAQLIDIAYTLQCGRHAMRCRLGFMARSSDDAAARLTEYLEAKGPVQGIYSGTVKRDQDTLKLLDADDDVATLVDTWISKNKYERLLELWVHGMSLEWVRLYRGELPKRVSLPAYPFAQERYWIPEADQRAETRTSNKRPDHSPVLHPLLHRNTSTLEGVRFSSVFSSDGALLPPEALIEMARAAVANVVMGGTAASPSPVSLSLRDVEFLRSPAMAEAGEVHVAIFPDEGTDLVYEIYTTQNDKKTVYLQGRASSNGLRTSKPIALDEIRLKCTTPVGTGEACKTLSAGIKSMQAGTGENGQTLGVAEIALPAEDGTHVGRRLSLLASVLEAAQALMKHSAAESHPQDAVVADRLPLFLREWSAHAVLPEKAIAIFHTVTDSKSASAAITLDIDLYDEGDTALGHLNGLVFGKPVSELVPRGETRAAIAQPIEAEIPDSGPAEVNTEELTDLVQKALRRSITSVLRMKSGDIDLDSELHEFGFDSISLVALAGALNETFHSELVPTIFFEHSTIRRLSEYLMDAHRPELLKALAPPLTTAKVPGPRAAMAEEPSIANEPQRRRRGVRRGYYGKSQAEAEPIAIIGMSGRFPQAFDAKELWKVLVSGKHCIGEVPSDRWDWRKLDGTALRDVEKSGTRWGGFVDGISEFDPLFFGISPREAEVMDPQQRLIMMHVWKAIEDAGYAPHRLSGTATALFIGMSASGYDRIVARAGIPNEGYTAAAFLPSIGPNRVSHFLNLHGPSEPIETACSSSLLAVHRAVHALHHEHCELAIAGGVNVILNQARHIGLGKAGMLSADGKCHTFAADANGYVRGEGIGMLFLKRLSAAERDGDHIYALVRGTAENHGGRGNSLTAPNPHAQAEVIKAAYMAATVDPRSVSYIEAHGTGTQLGDPIEIRALRSAFEDMYRMASDSGVQGVRCGLGSLKTNIGHLEMAAGVAGMIKVILQLQHRTLVKSLHCDEINPYIQFEGSPFYIVRENQLWEAAYDRDGTELPRRAGVSSFGFGGVNTHVLLEEYRCPQRPAADAVPEQPAVVVLSAASAEQLTQQAGNLLDAIAEHGFTDAQLREIAYTLQTGREAMEHRLAITAASVRQLESKLQSYVAGKSEIDGLYQGECRRNKEALAALTADADVAAVVDGWMKTGRLSKLIDLWVKGLPCDWSGLYGEQKPQRISLPTYPFLRDCYWAAVGDWGACSVVEVEGGSQAVLHPLLRLNTSNFNGIRFSSMLTGMEPLVADHLINNRKVLPAAMYMEMALAASNLAAAGAEKYTSAGLRDVVFLRPLIAGSIPVKVDVNLLRKDNGTTGFDIVSDSDGSGSIIHARGSVTFESSPDRPLFDPQALIAACAEMELGHRQCYEAFRSRGLNYGPAYQGIQELHVGNGQAVARIEFPAAALCEKQRYLLHPAMIDSALQAAIGLALVRNENPSERPAVMFSLHALDILDECPETGWAWVRSSENAKGPGDSLDVDLADDSGHVCVRLRGVITRRAAGSKPGMEERSESKIQTDALDEPLRLTLLPSWEPVAVDSGSVWPEDDRRVVVLGGTEAQQRAIAERYPQTHLLALSPAETTEGLTASLRGAGEIDHIFIALPSQGTPDIFAPLEQQQSAALICFRILKALYALGFGNRNLGLTVLTVNGQPVQPSTVTDSTHAAVHGLVGALAKEQKRWQVRVVDLELDRDLPLASLLSIAANAAGNAMAVRGGAWYREVLLPAVLSPRETGSFIQRGVYLVIGGAGGVGVAFTEYLSRQYQARVVWLGRRPEDEEIHSSLERLKSLGPEPWYIECDAADEAALQKVRGEIKARYGHIHGIVHASVVIDGCDLEYMEEERFVSAMSAKIAVAVQVARVFRQEPPEMVVYFSSIQSFEKTARHSYYAAGCNFSDVFARELARAWPCVVRVMNWGYWHGVGQTGASQSFHNWLEQSGMGTIGAQEAFAALESLLTGPLPQVACVRTNHSDAMQGVLIGPAEISVAAEKAPAVVECLKHFKPRTLSLENLDDTPAARAALMELLKRLLLVQLQSLGLLVEDGLSVAEWKRSYGLPALYDRWLDEAIRILGRSVVTGGPDPSAKNAVAVVGDVSPWQEWDEHKKSSDGEYHVARVNLVEAMVRALPEILSGKRPATDVMFPRGTLSLVEPLYTRSRISSYFNEVAADTVVAYVEARRALDPGCRLRMIEIGAGTGATSAQVLRKLGPYRQNIAEYRYTDISPVFLSHAEKTFGPSSPFLQVQILDISAPLAGQSVTPGSYDLVIGANVLHATRVMHETISNVKALLKSDGWIVINELTDHSLVAHLTFGLLKGWWLYEDEALRIPGSPLLSPENWQALLDREGFRSVTFPVNSELAPGQRIIVADSNGVIRQASVKTRSTAGPASSPVEPEQVSRIAEERPASAATPVKAVLTTGARQPVPQPARRSVPATVTTQMVAEYVRNCVLEELAKALKIDEKKLDCDEALANYGVDSILAVQTVDVLNERLGTSLTTTSLFDHSSINKLTAYIASEYGALMSQTLKQAATETRVEAARQAKASEEEVPARTATTRWSGPRSMARTQAEQTSQAVQTKREPVKPTIQTTFQQQPIAIIGMSGRFAKADSPEDLWGYLAAGTDLTEEVSRWDLSSLPGMATQGQHFRGGFLRDIDKFDPLFFSISGIEAAYMDPQQRVFLEESWKALENAGYAGASIEGRRCGVYAGHNGSDYSRLISGAVPPQAMWGNVASILSARISYFLNLQGPAITVDTACSSSLVAAHLACQALWSREIDFALAGGVYIQCTPGFYMSANRAGMLSPEGHCHTFDARADGLVPGEGAGVVVLKRLDDALKDGDHVYGVIRGSGINQDGATSGITAPSSVSQTRLEREVYERFNIDPGEIQMVEAHGTGTRLGDPIEFEALTNAFRKSTNKRGYCALGAIKTNIGHTTAASGVAGLIKIVLSLAHRQIPPSLHFEKANSQIDFDNSPFFVNTGLRDWKTEPGVTRKAAVSSFGLSGTNAHMVVEEAPEPVRVEVSRPWYLVAVSAQTGSQLRQQVERLRAYCEQNPQRGCADIAYTLMLGRKHLAHRLAIIVRSTSELQGALSSWLEKRKALNLYTGELKQRTSPRRESLKRYGTQCIATARDTDDAGECLETLGAVAELFVQGYTLEFGDLFGAGYRRIPLPVYAFAKDRYWVPESPVGAQSPVLTVTSPSAARRSETADVTPLHPLVHRRTPGQEAQYRSIFTGQEFFLADHVVRGVKVLPAMAYLEMARAAVSDARRSVNGPQRLCLQHIAFVRPLAMGDGPAQVGIELGDEKSNEARFTVSAFEDKGGNMVLCTGRVTVREDAEGPQLDLSGLRERCESRWPGDDCYARFARTGLVYGPAHRGVKSIACGVDAEGNPFVLADVELPGAVWDERELYVLHPGVLDAALQASAGFGLQRDVASPLLLPFAIEYVDVFAPSPVKTVALVRERAGAGVGSAARTFDLDVCEPNGRVCVRMRGITARAPSEGFETGTPVLSALQWTPQRINRMHAVSVEESRLVVFCAAADWPQAPLFRACAERISSESPRNKCHVIEPPTLALDESFTSIAQGVLSAVQELLRSRPTKPVRCQVIVPSDLVGWLCAALSPLLKTARLEDPKLHGKVIGISAGISIDRLTEIVGDENISEDELVRYEYGERQVSVFREMTDHAAEPAIPWKPHGVYLITGGTGGLGRIFAREIASRVEAPVIVLAGRSPLGETQRRALAILEKLGARAEYHSVDAGRKTEVETLIADISARWGRLDGILHGAGVLRDNFLARKTADELTAVFHPKVAGVLHLDEATQRLPLDFFVMFSSASSLFGAVGQSDYAMANAFLDRYSDYRAALVAEGRRQGRSVSFNWPWWLEGGMELAASSVASMTRRGLKPLSTADGLAAFYQGIGSGRSQVVVLAGQRDRVKTILDQSPALAGSGTAATPVLVPSADSLAGQKDQRAGVVKFLRQKFAETLQLPVDRIDAEGQLDQYGIDSVMVLELTVVLEQTFGSLSKTLMFEYQTIDALAGYFLENHVERLHALLNTGKAESFAIEADVYSKPAAEPATDLPSAEEISSSPAYGAQNRPDDVVATPHDIAIIGVSGRYPQARNLGQFWENLLSGRDCVTEVPAQRWDHSRYFDQEKGKPGKTYTKWGGFIDGVDEFDPLFFNLSPRDAELIDPQERLFLECVYETFEDAGYTREALKRQHHSAEANVGVYVGVMYEEYQFFGVQDQILGRPRAIVGSPSSIANRVSYFFNLHGPSMAVDTMCSSSLTAIHLACQSLIQGESEMAIAGGVNVSVHPNKYLIIAQGQFGSSTGRCKSFGMGGDGYVPAEGVGAVLLKPLARAILDGDQIYAVIKGSAVNHGGKTNGYTVPNPTAQGRVIARALEAAGISARTVSYIEAHGTGTSLGDPIEIAGLTRAFQGHTSDRQFCAIGSAKSSIGHAESAAGIAGVTKVLLQMRNGMLAPSLHAEQLNPHIDFGGTPFFVQREPAVWERPRIKVGNETREYPRIAGVSSFGAGGSNAHVLLQEYVAPAESAARGIGEPVMIVLSARSGNQLHQQASNLLERIRARGSGDHELPGIAYTLQVGREAFEHRLAFTANSMAQMQSKLERFMAGDRDVEELYRGEVKRDKGALAFFEADEELKEAITRGIGREKYARLLDLWVKGLVFDWKRLYKDWHPAPVSLPTYPFLGDKYWVPVTDVNVSVAQEQRLQATTEVTAATIRGSATVLTKQWEPAPLGAGDSSLRRALILTSSETAALATVLVERLPGSETIDLDAPDFGSVIEQMQWSAYNGWIDIAGCGLAKGREDQWMPCLQQWIEHGSKQERIAICITRGLESYKNGSINLSGAFRAGLYRMLQSEYRKLRSRHVDADAEESSTAFVDQIVAELHAGNVDGEVCYRGGERYRAFLQVIDECDSWLSGEGKAAAFPEEGVLLITGGTRGIGFECAKHFVRNCGVKRLVLTGRDVFPPRPEWQALLNRRHPLSEKIRAILALEAEGAQIRVSSVPLAAEGALRDELAEVRATFGPLRGVLHCAGVVDTETPAFIRKATESIQRVISPKVDGLNNLIQAVADDELQFMVLFSSISAIVPSLAVGQSDYAAANAYMDYVAAACAGRMPIVSIQWGSWKDAGFGEVRSLVYQKLGLLSQTNQEGLNFLDRVLARHAGPVIMPVMVEAERWQPHQLMQRVSEDSASRRIAPALSSGASGSTGSELAKEVESWLRSLIAGYLKLDPSRLDLEASLLDYGVDSVMLVQLARPIGEAVGAVLDPSILFEYPTVKAFAQWLVREHSEALSTTLQPPPEVDVRPDELAPAVAAIEAASARSSWATEIAVIGMACRFPRAHDLEGYWSLLAEGRVAIRATDGERNLPDDFYAGLLEGVSRFDPGYFLLSPADARAMDPQALILLEESVNAWHHAGYSREEIKGARVGVYFGGRARSRADQTTLMQADHPIIALGQNYLAANVSRFLDLRGPSLVVDTACSSALVGMQIAVQALHSGDINAALVGGVSLLDAAALRLFDQRGILNKSPHFHLLDQRARGTILGEGAAIVVLKTVEQALRDGDTIYAVVRAIAVNNDGRTASPTSPNLQSQREVMADAVQKAAVDATKVSHIEISGSGSEVTDLLELKAIESVYRPRRGRCDLGSMKPNIGHPLSAEGIASFVKVVLMLHHRQRVPFLSGEEPMRHFDLKMSPFELNRSLVPWHDIEFAAINSFADGGTNVHIILGPWSRPVVERQSRRPLPPPVLRKIDLTTGFSSSPVKEVPESNGSGRASGSDLWVPLTIAG